MRKNLRDVAFALGFSVLCAATVLGVAIAYKADAVVANKVADPLGNGYDIVGTLAPVSAPVAITPSDTATFLGGRFGTEFIVTASGNIKVGFANGTTMVIPVTSGLYSFQWQINQVFVTGSTATFTGYTLN